MVSELRLYYDAQIIFFSWSTFSITLLILGAFIHINVDRSLGFALTALASVFQGSLCLEFGYNLFQMHNEWKRKLEGGYYVLWWRLLLMLFFWAFCIWDAIVLGRQ